MGQESHFSSLRPVLEKSLAREHGTFLPDTNPVLESLRRREMEAVGGKGVVRQYSMLVIKIVEFLRTGQDRLKEWPEVKAELNRNIGQELGSDTDEITHYNLLKKCLWQELGLDIAGVVSSKATAEFLRGIEQGLRSGTPARVAGILYALEDSAVPELKIVARIINELSGLEHAGQLVDVAMLERSDTGTAQLSAIRAKGAANFSFADFIAIHVFDFEQGHRDFLWESLCGHIATPEQCQEFAAGFEEVLDAMDRWWVGLARGE